MRKKSKALKQITIILSCCRSTMLLVYYFFEIIMLLLYYFFLLLHRFFPRFCSVFIRICVCVVANRRYIASVCYFTLIAFQVFLSPCFVVSIRLKYKHVPCTRFVYIYTRKNGAEHTNQLQWDFFHTFAHAHCIKFTVRYTNKLQCVFLLQKKCIVWNQ